jgi:hypothetical protein
MTPDICDGRPGRGDLQRATSNRPISLVEPLAIVEGFATATGAHRPVDALQSGIGHPAERSRRSAKLCRMPPRRGHGLRRQGRRARELREAGRRRDADADSRADQSARIGRDDASMLRVSPRRSRASCSARATSTLVLSASSARLRRVVRSRRVACTAATMSDRIPGAGLEDRARDWRTRRH